MSGLRGLPPHALERSGEGKDSDSGGAEAGGREKRWSEIQLSPGANAKNNASNSVEGRASEDLAMPVGWGLVGTGEWVDQNIAPAIRQATNARCVALASRSDERARAFAAYHEVAHTFATEEELLGSPEVEVVVLATPNHLHKDTAIAAAAKGKHILCCAPMAISVADCRAMLDASRKHGTLFGMDFQHRHHHGFRRMKEIIDDGTIGEVFSARAQAAIPWEGGHRGRQVWTVPSDGAFASEHSIASMIRGRENWKTTQEMRGAGLLSGPGMLGLDTLRFILGRDVEQVFAKADITDTTQQETWVSALLTFEGGVNAHFECSRKTPYADNSFIVYGTKGRVAVHGFSPWDSCSSLELCTDKGTLVENIIRGNMYVAQIEAFSACVRDRREPNASGLDGLRERQVSLAIRESAVTGTAVRITE
jgi:predicted dehydrogenase